jgi:hypothetical protein
MKSQVKYINFTKTLHHFSVFQTLTIWSEEKQLFGKNSDEFFI